MNVIILDLKFARIDIRPRQIVQAWSVHIHDAPAIQTDEMMMPVQLGIESRRRTRMAGLGHETERSKSAEDSMHRHAGDLWQLTSNLAIQMLSRRMVIAIQNRFKNGTPLGRDRQATFTMGGEKVIQPFFSINRAHVQE